MRPLDPLFVILGCYALLVLRERLKASATVPAVPGTAEAPAMK